MRLGGLGGLRVSECVWFGLMVTKNVIFGSSVSRLSRSGRFKQRGSKSVIFDVVASRACLRMIGSQKVEVKELLHLFVSQFDA